MANRIEDLISESKGLLTRGSIDPVERISFGLPQLDALTGGGIPKKRLTILTGPPNVGKSYLASQTALSVQKHNGLVAWFDTEMTWDREWMEKCGLDVNNVMLSQENAGEAVFDVMKTLMKSGVDLIVLDSIAGLIPTVMKEEDFSYNPMAWQARFINQSLPRLIGELRDGSALLFINQNRSSMGPVALENMPGGLGQTYFSHFILQARRHGWIEEKGDKVGFDIELRCRKSKVGGKPFESCIVPFRLEGGIDLIETYIRESLDKGTIKRTGAWYTYGDNPKMQGMNGVKTFFVDHPEEFEKVKSQIDG